MKKIIPMLFVLFFLFSCAEMPVKSKQTVQGLSFQVENKTKRLIFGDSFFTESASSFWKTWPGQCTFHCQNENVLIVEMRTVNKNQQLITGTSVFIRKPDRYWYQSVTIPKREIDTLGGIASIVGLSNKVKVTYGNNEVREYPRMDVR